MALILLQEWRHAHGMRCLGIPNTAHFANVTLIEDAVACTEFFIVFTVKFRRSLFRSKHPLGHATSVGRGVISRIHKRPCLDSTFGRSLLSECCSNHNDLTLLSRKWPRFDSGPMPCVGWVCGWFLPCLPYIFHMLDSSCPGFPYHSFNWFSLSVFCRDILSTGFFFISRNSV